MCTLLLHPNSTQRADRRGPWVNRPHRSVRAEEGSLLTGDNSPPTRIAATGSPPTRSTQRPALGGLENRAISGAEHARRRPWPRRCRGLPSGGQTRPQRGAGRRERDSRDQGGDDARERREEEGAERGSPRSRALR
jgi:hypothetical protein